MSPSSSKISPTIMLCLLISTLITLCYTANNNSSGKTNPNMGTQQFSQHVPCGYGACFCAPEIPGMPGNSGPYGPQGIAGSPGPQGSTGPRGDKGDAGKPGNEGPLGPKGPPGALGPKGATGPQGSPGTLGGNWKQCVFTNLNDGKDTGLIKDCVFKKNADNTSLRVFWSGPLRIYNCHDCCRRWYFTFNGADNLRSGVPYIFCRGAKRKVQILDWQQTNIQVIVSGVPLHRDKKYKGRLIAGYGAECSAPAAIEGVVYMIHGDGAKKDLHRVRQIEGVCEKVHKGIVRVGFWVGNCAGHGSADAYTGWNSVSRIYVEELPPPQA